MRISKYSFGSITIDGKTYVKDVIILPDRVISPWWRKEGHSLCEDDLKEVFSANPAVLVIGTGEQGVMDVPDRIRKLIESKGIKVIIEDTTRAVLTFNSLGGDAVAALHLTC